MEFRLSKVTRRWIFGSDWAWRIDDDDPSAVGGDDGIESSENEDQNRLDRLRISKKGVSPNESSVGSLYLLYLTSCSMQLHPRFPTCLFLFRHMMFRVPST